MATGYPASIDAFHVGSPLSTDSRDDPSLAGEITDLNDAVFAIETELGLHPSGPSTTVVERLDTYGTAIGDAEADIVALIADMSAAQTGIVNNADAINVLDGQVASLQADSGSNAGDIGDLQAKVGTGASLPTDDGAVLQSNGTDTAWVVQLRSAQGSAAGPTYSFLDDPTTGVMLVNAGQMGLVSGGGVRAVVTNDGVLFGPYVNAADRTIAASVIGDSFHRYRVDADGTIRWSTGVADVDTEWGRLGVGIVGTSGGVRSGGFAFGADPAVDTGYLFVASDVGQTGLRLQGMEGHASDLISVIDNLSASIFSLSYDGLAATVPAVFDRTTVGQLARASVVAADATAAYSADLSAGNVHDITLTENATLAVTNPVTGHENTLYLTVRQDATGGWTLTWPAGVWWEGGVAPVVTAGPNAVDRFVLTTYDDGVSFFGRVLGQDFSEVI